MILFDVAPSKIKNIRIAETCKATKKENISYSL